MGFFEASTRTQLSFESAGLELGIQWMKLESENSSLKKGESFKDTFSNINLYDPDFYVIRHSMAGLPHLVQKWTRKPVINAGDGMNEHPTQALGDALTLHKAFKSKRLKICFFGDVYRSRVFRSNLKILKVLGHSVSICDDGSVESALTAKAFKISLVPRKSLNRFDVIYCLRIQKERGSEWRQSPLAPEDFSDKTFLMHAGPVMINSDLRFDLLNERADRNLILAQARNCFEVRRSLLLELGGKFK